MNTILELQTGQVSFLSGIMAGFSLSIAVQIIRHDVEGVLSDVLFVFFASVSMLFLLALYIDTRLLIELASMDTYSDSFIAKVAEIRRIGTFCASIALYLFVLAIGTLGWYHSRIAGIVGGTISFVCLIVFFVTNRNILALVQ